MLKSDDTAIATTHWDQLEDALEQFSASLRLVGHDDHAVRRHLSSWHQMPGPVPAFTVYNPDFQGSIRISITQPRGG